MRFDMKSEMRSIALKFLDLFCQLRCVEVFFIFCSHSLSPFTLQTNLLLLLHLPFRVICNSREKTNIKAIQFERDIRP